jgi:DNA-binding beta-propeller fold protein YncE
MIDIGAQKEARRIDVAPLSRPHGLAFAGGKVYFTAEASKKIARYDPAANKIDWEFETGQTTTHMLLPMKDPRTIFTSNIGSDSVSMVEQAASGWAQTVIPVGKGPEGIDVSPNGREVWSAHSRDGGVSIIDRRDEEGRPHDRARHQAIEPHQADARREVRARLGSGRGRSRSSSTRPRGRKSNGSRSGKMPEGILITPDGSQVFVAVNGDNNVAVVDPKSWTCHSADHCRQGA